MKNRTIGGLVAATALLAASSAFAGGQVSTTHSTMKVRPTDPAPTETPANLMAARNEFVSFQIVVQADGSGANNVSASFSGLNGPSTIAGSNITLYREAYLNITQPSFADAPQGLYPDALIPDVDETVGEKRNAFPFNVAPNQNGVIWVDILIPKDAPPGAYTGTVSITGDGVQREVPVSVNVLNTELPSTSSVKSTFLFHRNLACSVHTGDSECGGEAGSFELRKKYQKMALEHRFTLSNTLTMPNGDPSGLGDWATFDQRYTPWMDGSFPTRLPGARVTTIQVPGKRDMTKFAEMQAHFEQKGWLDRLYDYTGDEPPYGISFEEASSRLQAVKAAAPKIRTLLTTTVQAADEHGISQYLDLVVPVINHMDGSEAPYVGEQRPAYDGFVAQPGKELWIYQSCMSHSCAFGTNSPENKPGQGWPSYMADASAAKNRAMQWLVFTQKATGELYYETALALDTAWDNIFRFNGNGDGTLFYPGLPSRIGGTTDVPVPSFRMKQIRQGMQDYEWLKKVADAGDPAFAMKVAKTLLPTAHSVPDDGGSFENARLQLISRYLELTPQSAPAENQPVTVTPVEGSPYLGTPTNPDGTAPIIPGSDPGVTPGIGEMGPDDGSAAAGCVAAGPAVSGMALVMALSALLRRRRRD